MKGRNVFAVAVKSVGFGWRTNKTLLLSLIALNIFQGSIVYVQFTGFASIVDEIIRIRQGMTDMAPLIRSSVILGFSFLVPPLAGYLASYLRNKFRLQQNVELEMHKIDRQGTLDIGTIESSSYQNMLRGAQEWGSGSVMNVQDFVFTTASSFAGIITSMIILWLLNPWLVLFAFLAAAPVYFFYNKYSKEVFRIRYFSLDDHRIISNRVSHFEELQKAVDVILLKLKSWPKEQIRDRKVSFNKKIVQAEGKKSLSYGILSLWYFLFLFAAVGLMTREALAGTIALGKLLLAFNTYTRFHTTVNGYLESISFTEEAARYALRWFDLFELKPKIQSKPDAQHIDSTEPPHMEFKNVSFRYPSESGENEYVLKDLSFSIRPGGKDRHCWSEWSRKDDAYQIIVSYLRSNRRRDPGERT